MATDDRGDAARRIAHAFAPEDLERVPYYAALAVAMSTSTVAIDLLLEAPVEQRNPMLLFAVLHLLALQGHRDLAPLFAPLGAAHDTTPEQFASAVLAVMEREPELLRAHMRRTTQTNEVGRSAVLQAILRELRRRGVDAVNLVDIGCSAGLNLYLDFYPVSPTPVGDDFTLVCESLTSDDQPGELPRIVDRYGIDVNPLDLNDADDELWLRACLWPEDRGRLRRLSIIEQSRSQWPAVTLHTGDVLTRLDDALAAVETSVATVVMHTWVAAYFPPELQERFAARMRELTATRNVYWVACEWPRAVAGLSFPTPLTPEPHAGACQIVVTEPGGEPHDWGWCHAHGRWLSLSPTPGPKA